MLVGDDFTADDAFYQACRLRGVDPTELEAKPFSDFEEKGLPAEISATRFNCFQERRFRKLCLVMQTRQDLLLSQSGGGSSPTQSPLHLETPSSGRDSSSAIRNTNNIVDISRQKFTYYKHRAEQREQALRRRKDLDMKSQVQADAKRDQYHQEDAAYEQQKEFILEKRKADFVRRENGQEELYYERKEKEKEAIVEAKRARQVLDARLDRVRKNLAQKKKKDAVAVKRLQEEREEKLNSMRIAAEEKVQHAKESQQKKMEDRHLRTVVTKFLRTERYFQKAEEGQRHTAEVLRAAGDILEQRRAIKLAIMADKQTHSIAHREHLLASAPPKLDIVARSAKTRAAHDALRQKEEDRHRERIKAVEDRLSRSEQRRNLDHRVRSEYLSCQMERRLETARRVRLEDTARREEMRRELDKKNSEIERKLHERNEIIRSFRADIVKLSSQQGE